MAGASLRPARVAVPDMEHSDAAGVARAAIRYAGVRAGATAASKHGRQDLTCNLLTFDLHRLQHNVFVRLVLSASWDGSDLVHHVLALNNFSEDGVVPGEPSGRRRSDEELRAVCVRTGVRHRELPRLI